MIFPDITPWRKAIGILVAISALAALEQAYEHHIWQQGYDKAESKWDEREKGITLKTTQMLSDAKDKAAKDERSLRDYYDERVGNLMKVNKDHETTENRLRSDVRSGALKLSVSIARCSVRGATESADSSASTNPGGEARADLLPETSEAILSIAGESARTVRDFNTVIDLYNAARKTCNLP